MSVGKMQLTMSKGFNKEEIRKMLQKEEQFISHILSIMPVSAHELGEYNFLLGNIKYVKNFLKQ